MAHQDDPSRCLDYENVLVVGTYKYWENIFINHNRTPVSHTTMDQTDQDADVLVENFFTHNGISYRNFNVTNNDITPSKIIGKELVKYAQSENVRYLCICVPILCGKHGLQDEDASNWQKLLISLLRNIHTLKQVRGK